MEQALHLEREIADIKAKQAAADEQHKTIFKRLDQQDELLKSVHSLATSVSTMSAQQEQMEDKIDRVCSDLSEIKARPGKRWESIKDKIWLSVVGALIGALLAHFGL